MALAHAYDGWLPTGTTWSGAVAGTVSRTFDNNFRVTSQSVNGANPVAIAYDGDGLLTQVGVLAVTRNAQTGLVTATALGAIADATSYDGFGAVATFTASRGGSPVYAVAYTRDALGRITGKTETVNGTTRGFLYAYDPAGRLAEVRRDGSRRRHATPTMATATASPSPVRAAPSRPPTTRRIGSRSTGTRRTHTRPTGELRSKAAGGGTTVYQYDGLGTLIGVTLSDGRQIDYLVDGAGPPRGKSIDGVRVQGFLYQDGLRPIAELDGAGAVAAASSTPIEATCPRTCSRTGVTYRIIVDHLGQPPTGDRRRRAARSRRSSTTTRSASSSATPTRGSSRSALPAASMTADTRLVRFGARDYDAETGRWTAKDPIGFESGPNLYEYAGSDPVNLIDPLGEQPEARGLVYHYEEDSGSWSIPSKKPA